tara:strand:- start:309 stop:551 length:243 start_codon:yes stop_codon:yes gene_type:complete
MKNRTEEQAQKHKDYMREYYRKNAEQRKKNAEKSNKRGLEKISCVKCQKYITRVNMKRHVLNKHTEKTKNGILLEKVLTK